MKKSILTMLLLASTFLIAPITFGADRPTFGGEALTLEGASWPADPISYEQLDKSFEEIQIWNEEPSGLAFWMCQFPGPNHATLIRDLRGNYFVKVSSEDSKLYFGIHAVENNRGALTIKTQQLKNFTCLIIKGYKTNQ